MILRLVVTQLWWEPTLSPTKIKAKAREQKQLMLGNSRALPGKSLVLTQISYINRLPQWPHLGRQGRERVVEGDNQPSIHTVGNPASLKIQSRTRTTTAKRGSRV